MSKQKRSTLRTQRKGPLIFVDQPEWKVENTSMQGTYRSKNKVEETEHLTEPESEKEAKEINGEIELQGTDEKVRLPQFKVPFHKLSIEEKLESLRALPMRIVKIVYLFVTEKKVYQGYFVSNKDGEVTIKPVRGKKHLKIPVEEITDVILKRL
ncbi:CotO family spore coat protein [Bacillus sp. REN3]|uniref:CotO family spore coat protein n=1 Tax=Bacillus sp. REN3 TaxID=2802440 RepID=UPI001AEDE0E2|nr:CotO family spore coat protein [Bacillus sp. REN3]